MNSLKSRAINCGPLSEITCGFAVGYFSLSPLEDDLDFSLRHRVAHIPLDNGPAVPDQHAAQILERANNG